ncbi:hypothetical protein SAMN05444274_102254 [Mariniphaga anaerophila]|uniref:LVIVD repeat-containing protein n=1 Tax=Mariniphaga anaerophila TaxID=1484053 RepID=A0A1M4VZ10_9BACT|nr:hypothetical protein [Mariniphaga anaerophila]SHE74140.1 hypothetical protein SAMN05444274_102254 [Mariniphaga anaerophila]
MKKLLPYSFLLLIIFAAVVGFDVLPPSGYEPVFMLRSEMEKNVQLDEPRSVKNPGKIYLKDHLIFINEKYKGIHVIDNSNPENPENVAFVKIDGCIDIAVKNNVLYADNAVDLIALKFDENLTAVNVVKRVKNVFPEPVSPDGRGLSWQEKQAVPDDAIVVRWEHR